MAAWQLEQRSPPGVVARTWGCAGTATGGGVAAGAAAPAGAWARAAGAAASDAVVRIAARADTASETGLLADLTGTGFRLSVQAVTECFGTEQRVMCKPGAAKSPNGLRGYSCPGS